VRVAPDERHGRRVRVAVAVGVGRPAHGARVQEHRVLPRRFVVVKRVQHLGAFGFHVRDGRVVGLHSIPGVTLVTWTPYWQSINVIGYFTEK
jgi:hypothetical protein